MIKINPKRKLSDLIKVPPHKIISFLIGENDKLYNQNTALSFKDAERVCLQFGYTLKRKSG